MHACQPWRTHIARTPMRQATHLGGGGLGSGGLSGGGGTAHICEQITSACKSVPCIVRSRRVDTQVPWVEGAFARLNQLGTPTCLRWSAGHNGGRQATAVSVRCGHVPQNQHRRGRWQFAVRVLQVHSEEQGTTQMTVKAASRGCDAAAPCSSPGWGAARNCTCVPPGGMQCTRMRQWTRATPGALLACTRPARRTPQQRHQLQPARHHIVSSAAVGVRGAGAAVKARACARCLFPSAGRAAGAR